MRFLYLVLLSTLTFPVWANNDELSLYEQYQEQKVLVRNSYEKAKELLKLWKSNPNIELQAKYNKEKVIFTSAKKKLLNIKEKFLLVKNEKEVQVEVASQVSPTQESSTPVSWVASEEESDVSKTTSPLLSPPEENTKTPVREVASEKVEMATQVEEQKLELENQQLIEEEKKTEDQPVSATSPRKSSTVSLYAYSPEKNDFELVTSTTADEKNNFQFDLENAHEYKGRILQVRRDDEQNYQEKTFRLDSSIKEKLLTVNDESTMKSEDQVNELLNTEPSDETELESNEVKLMGTLE